MLAGILIGLLIAALLVGGGIFAYNSFFNAGDLGACTVGAVQVGDAVRLAAKCQPTATTAQPTAQPTATTAQPTATTAQPTATTKPANPPKLTATSQPTAFCANGQYPTIVVKNAGGGTLTWTATPKTAGVSVSPTGGSLGAGASKNVTVTGPVPPNTSSVSIAFSGNGGSSTVKFTCQ
jgi:hypothetical protein